MAMFNCFKCSESYLSIQLLCKHIKYFHGWVSGEILVCNEAECYQKFAHLDRYKRHLANVHKNENPNHASTLPTLESFNNMEIPIINSAMDGE